MPVMLSFKRLMSLAKDEAEAKKSGNIKRIQVTARRHTKYKELCRKSGGMLLEGFTQGNL